MSDVRRAWIEQVDPTINWGGLANTDSLMWKLAVPIQSAIEEHMKEGSRP